ncbi:hypothetical protein [Mucilaginibacter sp. SP1R1]|uniref:hypothetical protein n=1 Tax=Mucilaginibacter sp. SP1R1 TaxID=2723091 RepID=UPI00161BED56|nr:hypothetical protein [Mucilaginibacter sp. SP1R1]MBB6149926.1 hypothetical protein [Mucilaginibacter sp. SP1R1]
MNHVSENALIVGTLLLIFIVPVYIISRQSKKRRKAKLNERLLTAIQDRQLSLTRSELIGNKIIGWDQSNKMLLFTAHDSQSMNVNDLKAASRSYVIKNMNGSAVKSVKLQVVDPNNMLLCSIPFYEQFMDNELKIKQLDEQAKGWEQLLNSHFAH